MSRALQHVDALRLSVELLAEVTSGRICDLALREVGVNRSALRVPGQFVPYALQAALIERVARRIGVRHLGALAASRYRYGELGPYAGYVLAAPDLGTAIRRGTRALPYLQPGSAVTVRLERDFVLLGFSTGIETVVGARQIEEGMPLVLCHLVRSFLGSEWRPLRVELPHREGGREADLAGVFEGSEIRFGAQTPAIAISLRDVGVRNPDRASTLHPAVLSDVRAMVRSRPPRNDTELVGNILQLQIRCGDPSEDGVAQRLGIGRRTLQRRLQAEGTSFRELQQRALQLRAEELIAEGDHSIADVARALCFREVNSFRRAFRTWTGVTPTRYASIRQRDRGSVKVGAEGPDQSQGKT